MSISHLHEACDNLAAQLDAVLAEIEPFEHLGRAADVYELVTLAQACLTKAAALSRDFDEEPLSDGIAGLAQITTAALRDEPAPEGLELDAIAEIVTTVKASMRDGGPR